MQTFGWLIAGKTVLTQKDDPLKFLTFEDDTAIVEIRFFSKAYHRICHIQDHGQPYLIPPKVEEN